MKKEKITEEWVKLTSKELVKEFGIEQGIQEGLSAGYMDNLNYKVYKDEVYMKPKVYKKRKFACAKKGGTDGK